jgi:flagellum-specific ATP synthase
VSTPAARVLAAVRAADYVRRIGRITRLVGLSVESTGPAVQLGEVCEIAAGEGGSVHAVLPARVGGVRRTLAEVVGFSDSRVQLMPYEEPSGLRVGDEVIATGRGAEVWAGDHLLGRVIDGFGVPLDGSPLGLAGMPCPIYPAPINPLHRGTVREVLETGIRSVDTLLTLARGQRVGIFSGSGVGKSIVLGMLARAAHADVSVIALVGERGREVQAFVENGLPQAARAKSVVVAATSDQPPLVRRRAAFLATALAEHYRDRGLHVCLLMDSVTRVAMAQREIGLAGGELPTARGYTPSVFTLLPRLLERGGVRAAGGSLTAFYTVLVEGDDLNDPIADSVRAILDGHIVLSRAIAQRGRYPAIDITQSVSRLASSIVSEGDAQVMADAIQLLAAYETSRDLIEVGAYRAGTNAVVDRAIKLVPEIERFLAQRPGDVAPRGAAMDQLRKLLHEPARAP